MIPVIIRFSKETLIISTDYYVTFHSDTQEDQTLTCLFGPHTVPLVANKHFAHWPFSEMRERD